MRRRELLAYLIGAGVAGTALVLPYGGRAIATVAVPELVTVSVPFFLLPIAWGVWNWLWVRLQPPVPAAGWGALLGLLASSCVNLLLALRGQWFGAVALLLVWIPAVYALAYAFIIEPLNRALGAKP